MTVALVGLFSYANLLCATGCTDHDECQQADADDHCEGTEAGHPDQTPAQHPNDCSKSGCFCATMNTVVTQPSVTNPARAPLPGLEFAVIEFANGMPAMKAVVAYEHGPPSIAPPEHLFTRTLSPRAPPLGA